MPQQQILLQLNKTMTPTAYARLKRGLRPQSMEDKWFIYWEDGKVYFHRSWTDFCIFIVESTLQPNGDYLLTQATVNQDDSQFNMSDTNAIKTLLEELIEHITHLR